EPTNSRSDRNQERHEATDGGGRSTHHHPPTNVIARTTSSRMRGTNSRDATKPITTRAATCGYDERAANQRRVGRWQAVHRPNYCGTQQRAATGLGRPTCVKGFVAVDAPNS